jgi:hypothetical protein
MARGTDMINRVLTAFASGIAGAALVLGVAATPVSASAASAARCSARMSNSHPADYTTTHVVVRTVGYAAVTAVAHYKTVKRKHSAYANSAGRARIAYYISGATPGYRVRVSVRVRKGGRAASCSTSFTPHS